MKTSSWVVSSNIFCYFINFEMILGFIKRMFFESQNYLKINPWNLSHKLAFIEPLLREILLGFKPEICQHYNEYCLQNICMRLSYIIGSSVLNGKLLSFHKVLNVYYGELVFWRREGGMSKRPSWEATRNFNYFN